MKIVLIGSGNVATRLGLRMRNRGHQILQVLARNASTGGDLSFLLRTSLITTVEELSSEADIYVIAVQDRFVRTVAAAMKPYFPQEKIIVHTAGSLSVQELSAYEHYGVLYPMQSLRKEMTDDIEIPLLVDGSDARVLDSLQLLAYSLTDTVYPVNDGERLDLHIAAVFVSNFTNYLFALAEDWCEKKSVPFASLQPLIEETVKRMRHLSPRASQTGPAVRRDGDTLRVHGQKLHPLAEEQAAVYAFLSRQIQQSPLLHQNQDI